jgi:hypothetical protein
VISSRKSDYEDECQQPINARLSLGTVCAHKTAGELSRENDCGTKCENHSGPLPYQTISHIDTRERNIRNQAANQSDGDYSQPRKPTE